MLSLNMPKRIFNRLSLYGFAEDRYDNKDNERNRQGNDLRVDHIPGMAMECIEKKH